MIIQKDALTEVLDLFPLPIRYTGHFQLTAPWGIAVPKRSALVCAVRGGDFWLTTNDLDDRRRIAPGDVLVLSPTSDHHLQDRLNSPVVSIHEIVDSLAFRDRSSHSQLAYTAHTRLTGSVLEFNGRGIHPLCRALPPYLHLQSANIEASSGIGGILRTIETELSEERAGGAAIVHRLVEVLMVQMARLHLGKAGEAETGVMRGMMHRDLGPALTRIHRQPDRPWTVATLAQQANMSRSSFSAAFTRVLEVPPLQYLREYRMRMASQLLRDSSLGLKQIASRVGYDSVSAFSTAFKRFSGLAPGDYRHRNLSEA